jgi:hypothetical protein
MKLYLFLQIFSRSAIMNANYQVSYSHCNKNSIKTNAPPELIWSILKEWIKLNPIKEKWMDPKYKVFHILRNLQNSSSQTFDFTIRFVT